MISSICNTGKLSKRVIAGKEIGNHFHIHAKLILLFLQSLWQHYPNP